MTADPAAPILDAEQLAVLAGFGERRAVRAGDVLYAEGDAGYDRANHAGKGHRRRHGSTLRSTAHPTRLEGCASEMQPQRTCRSSPT